MVSFTKMHGLGNHFLFFDEMTRPLNALKSPRAIVTLCSPTVGMGADGLVFIGPPADSANDCRMQIFNNDASEAEMCGNAIRCVAHLMLPRLPERASIRIETKGGLKEVQAAESRQGFPCYRVYMGKAQEDLVATGELAPPDARTPMIWDEAPVQLEYVNVGNPHGVCFLRHMPGREYMADLGAWLETHPNHPRRINIEFVETISPHEVRVTVWERGCGFTQACGTGATAVAATGTRTGALQSPVTVHMPGGDLIIEAGPSGLFMTGPVQEVAVGTLAAPFLASLDGDGGLR